MKKFFAFLGVFMAACSSQTLKPPVAEIVPMKLEKHGDQRVDNYFWLKERESTKVIDYLNQQNAYTDQAMADTKPLQEKLYQEMRSRMKEDDSSVPYKDGEYYYYARFEQGREYPIYARKHGERGDEEILLDVNELARGHSYCSIPMPEPSKDHHLLAFAMDTVGRRFHTIYFKDLRTGKMLSDKIESVTANFVWANDNKTVFYVRQDPETLRAYELYRHEIGHKKDTLVYEEKADAFELGIGKSLSEDYLIATSSSTLSSEVRTLRADEPAGEFKVFLPREKNHEYTVTDGKDGFYVLTNFQAKNFRLMHVSHAHTDKKHWQEVVPHRPDVLLEDFEVFQDWIVLLEREHGLSKVEVLDRKNGARKNIAFPDPAYTVSLGTNAEYDADFVRYQYESMVRPESVYDYNFAKSESTLRKERVVHNYNPADYTSERIFVSARDGAKVPVSIVYRKDLKKPAPLLLYGYGSYGMSMEPWYQSVIFSLVDRGFVYAIAHVRGGSEMGRAWYEDGRQLKKKNTFTDFIDVAEELVKAGYGKAGHLYAEGGSAGGLLMGAVANLRPDLFHGIVADVPFVDVLTTMLDDSIPLTTGEYDEWGNPNDKTYYDYMKSYSPYDNVSARAYPNILVTTGFHDSQVQYWEPAKWVAKLQAVKTNDALVLLKTEMSAGHGGVSGRFESLRLEAQKFAFYLMLEK